MIKLRNNDINLSFEFDINSYQFPVKTNDFWDDNWCNLTIKINQNEQRFTATDPAITTNELLELREWFATLSQHQIPHNRLLKFIEPCIQFQLITCQPSEINIIIELNWELKPSFRLDNRFNYEENDQITTEEADWKIPFKLTAQDCNAIINQLDKLITRYPVRSH